MMITKKKIYENINVKVRLFYDFSKKALFSEHGDSAATAAVSTYSSSSCKWSRRFADVISVHLYVAC